MKYKVISFFTDLQDNDHPYNPGDEYPREGATASKSRITELMGNKNRQGKPLIETVEEPPEDFMPIPESPEEYQEKVEAEEAKPKRSRKKKTDAE